MGQGAEDAGGYEIEYNPYDHCLSDEFNYWTGRDGARYDVSKMADRHIKNCIRMCKDLAECATFSCDADLWDSWVDVFEKELNDRKIKGISIKGEYKRKTRKPPKSIKNAFSSGNIPESGTTVMICHCGQEYSAKVADLKRGWGLSCSKRCASIRRDYGRPAATVKANAKTL